MLYLAFVVVLVFVSVGVILFTAMAVPIIAVGVVVEWAICFLMWRQDRKEKLLDK